MSLTFPHETLGQRVFFASGEAVRGLAAEVERLDATTVIVIGGA